MDEHTMMDTVGLKPKLAKPRMLLIEDVATTPNNPPAAHASKRVCTMFLPSRIIGLVWPGNDRGYCGNGV